MTDYSAEFENFLPWFVNLEEIFIYDRRDFLAHVIEVGGIDEKAAQFIDDALAHIQDNQERKIAELDNVNALCQSLDEQAPEMAEQDIQRAEAEMQRIADKFCNEFREAQTRENQAQEKAAQASEKTLVTDVRQNL